MMADLTRISAAMKTKDDAFFKRLGARIAQARKRMGMTQVQLAERLGIAQQTLAHYEVGRARIAADLLPVLAEALEVSLDEMLIGEPAARPAGKRFTPSAADRGHRPTAQGQAARRLRSARRHARPARRLTPRRRPPRPVITSQRQPQGSALSRASGGAF